MGNQTVITFSLVYGWFRKWRQLTRPITSEIKQEGGLKVCTWHVVKTKLFYRKASVIREFKNQREAWFSPKIDVTRENLKISLKPFFAWRVNFF